MAGMEGSRPTAKKKRIKEPGEKEQANQRQGPENKKNQSKEREKGTEKRLPN